MSVLVGQVDVAGIDGGRKSLLVTGGAGGRIDLEPVEDPVYGHLRHLVDIGLRRTGCIAQVVDIGSKLLRQEALRLEEDECRRGNAECPGVADAYLDGLEVVGRRYDLRRRRVITGVGVARLGVVHAVVVGVGIVDRLRIGERVVNGTVYVDHHLLVGGYLQGVGEVPDAVDGGYIALGLINKMAILSIPFVVGLTVIG